MAITVTFPGGVRVDASLGDFTVHTDQPLDLGGDASAPAPFAYFLASLASCAGYFVLRFLQARNLPTAGLKLVQDHQFDRETHRLARVTIRIELPPGFPAKYTSAVRHAAEHCTVKQVIANPPEFAIEVG